MTVPRSGPKTIIDIRGPHFKHTEYAPDKHSPPTYSQRIYALSLPEPEPFDEVVSTLEHGLQACVNAIPVLASMQAHGIPGKKNTRHIVPSEEGQGVLKFVVHDLRAHISFPELEKNGFPLSAFSADELMPIIGFGIMPERMPAAFVQANIVQGGLLLGVCVSHYIMDGISISNFIALLGRNCRAFQESQAASEKLSDGAHNPGIMAHLEADLDVAKALVPHKAFVYHPEGASIPLPTGSKFNVENVPKQIRIEPTAAHTLVTDIRKTSPNVSKHDAVVGLLWRSVVRASWVLGRTRTNLAEISLPVEIRRMEEFKLAKDYIGNAFYLSEPQMQLPDLVGDDGLAKAAAMMRQTINDVSFAKVKSFYEAINAAGDEGWFWTVFPKLMPLCYDGGAGFFMTTHYYHDLDQLDFGPLFGSVKCYRLPREGLAGVTTIMPRASQRYKDGFEIMLDLDQPMWDVLAKDEVWTKYTTVGV